jgi:ubiquitin carboxyl-terminal hydrolase 25/28
MDVGEAYALLDIPDRTSELDLDTLRETVTVVCSEKPENKEMYERAYRAICEDQARNFVTYNSAVQSSRTDRPLASWPVGCMNNGNTCYLNSVLQFLFTVKPLRDMVLDCEAHFQDTSPQALQTKKVGRCEVTPERVELAQQCQCQPTTSMPSILMGNSHAGVEAPFPADDYGE